MIERQFNSDVKNIDLETLNCPSSNIFKKLSTLYKHCINCLFMDNTQNCWVYHVHLLSKWVLEHWSSEYKEHSEKYIKRIKCWDCTLWVDYITKNLYWWNLLLGVQKSCCSSTCIHFYDYDTVTLEYDGAFTIHELIHGILHPLPVIRRWLQGVKCPPHYLRKFGARTREFYIWPNFIWFDHCQALHYPI